MDSKELGRFGEKIAQNYLKNKGYKILARNFKRKWGEVDIVAKEKKKIIFVEVKTILEKEGFFAEDEIDQRKKRQLIKMAQIYLQELKIPLDSSWQIDIIAIEISPDFKKAKIKHYKNAIEDIY
jgi:putative endonuclease